MKYTFDDKIINIPKVLISILLFVSLIIYWIQPYSAAVSMPLFYTCFTFMLVSNYIYFKGKRKVNYLDFDTIFILIYCLVGFSTTFIYSNHELFKSVFLGFPVDEKYINKGNILFLIGLQAYMIGSLIPIKVKSIKTKLYTINSNYLILLVFILILSFVAFGGINYYMAEYNDSVKSNSSEVVKYILLLLVTTAMALIGTEFYNKKINTNYKISWFAFGAMFFLICTLLFIGNRTAASQILLPIICLYALFFKKINFKKFIIFILIGIPFMWLFQQLRTGDSNFELSNPIFLILDLTIPMRNTYAAIDYVDRQDFTYGSSMAIDISGVIPFLPSFVQETFPDLKPGSAALLTEYTFNNTGTPEEFQVGLGTTIIADIYLAFGVIGVVLFMWFLGKFVNKYTVQSSHLNYYAIVALCGLLGNTIFMVRGGFFHPLRFIIWALIIACINNLLQRAWKR